MSGSTLRTLRNSLGPELLAAQSEVTSTSEVVLEGPIDLHGIIIHTSTAGTNFPRLFDDGVVKLTLGTVFPSEPSRSFIFHPGAIKFATNLAITKASATRTLEYTLLYTPG